MAARDGGRMQAEDEIVAGGRLVDRPLGFIVRISIDRMLHNISLQRPGREGLRPATPAPREVV
jgi:hypothetical protein